MKEYIVQFWNLFLIIITILQLMNLKKSIRIILLIFTSIILFIFLLFLPDNKPIEYKIFILINFSAFIISLLIIKFLWMQSKHAQTIKGKTHRYRTYFLSLLIICSAIFPINVSREIYILWRIEKKVIYENLDKIFPQILNRTYATMHAWGSNGKCKYEIFHDEKDIKEFYLTLNIQVWGSKCSDGAGWLLIPFPLYNISDLNILEFDIKGRKGGEIIGMSLKDIQCNEVNIDTNIGMFCPDDLITTSWQKCTIPLFEFKNINLSSIEAIGFYVNRALLPDFTDPQEVDIATFRIR